MKLTGEQKQNIAQHNVDKFSRLSEYSLDEKNKQEWSNKEKKWHENIANTDIRESDLGDFKEKLRADTNIDKEYYVMLKDKFSHGSSTAKKAFNKFVPKEAVADANYIGIPCFNTRENKIYMNFNADKVNSRGECVTWFHEHGHLIDNAIGNISDSKDFLELLEKDSYNYRVKYANENNLRTWDKVNKAISMDLDDMRKHSGVSDIFEGASQGNIKGIAGHPEGYWNEKKTSHQRHLHICTRRNLMKLDMQK